MSLPTKEKYEELKEKRKQEQEKRVQQERLVRLCTDMSTLIFHTLNKLLNVYTSYISPHNRQPRRPRRRGRTLRNPVHLPVPTGNFLRPLELNA